MTLALYSLMMINVSEHYLLAPLGDSDWNLVLTLWSDPAVRNYLGGTVSLAQIRATFTEMLAARSDCLFYTIKARSDQTAIGLLSIADYHEPDKKELSYQLLPAYWGQNIAFGCIQAFLDFALPLLKQERIYAETQSANLKSMHLLQRLGFREHKRLLRFGAEQSVFCKSYRPEPDLKT